MSNATQCMITAVVLFFVAAGAMISVGVWEGIVLLYLGNIYLELRWPRND